MLQCLAVLQPWASLIVHGFKSYETRSWMPQHHAPLLIQAIRRQQRDDVSTLRNSRSPSIGHRRQSPQSQPDRHSPLRGSATCVHDRTKPSAQIPKFMQPGLPADIPRGDFDTGRLHTR
jgi:hypothetical protein